MQTDTLGQPPVCSAPVLVEPDSEPEPAPEPGEGGSSSHHDRTVRTSGGATLRVSRGSVASLSALHRRLQESPLLQQLANPHRFHHGDEVSQLAAGTPSGKRCVAVGMALGMAIPIPGFALVGGLTGAVASNPAVQLPIVRCVQNRAVRRMVVTVGGGLPGGAVTAGASSGGEGISDELCLRLRMSANPSMGSNFAESAVYSLGAGELELSGGGPGDDAEPERLRVFQRVDNYLVEDAFTLEPAPNRRVHRARLYIRVERYSAGPHHVWTWLTPCWCGAAA